MIERGFFEQFPCDAMFALHDRPGHPEGTLDFMAGPAMASSHTVLLSVRGKGGHGARPQLALSPVVVASAIVLALQTIVSRKLPPLDWVGEAGIMPPLQPLTGSENFSLLRDKCKGNHLLLGNGVDQGQGAGAGAGAGAGGCRVYNPGDDFNDRCLGTGASHWMRLAEAFLV
jgi:metal-dependent amidase/aminoacylase/carboxypeptidase family protein